MGRLLSREEILGAGDIQRERVAVPEWGEGGEVLVSGLSAADQLEMAQYSLDGADGQRESLELMIKIPARCIVDADGQRVFSDDDVALLGQKSRAPLQRIMETAMRLSALDVEESKKG